MRVLMRGFVILALASSVAAGCSDKESSVAVPGASTVPSASTSTDGRGSTRVEVATEATSPDTGVVEVRGTVTVPDGAQVNWALTPLPQPDSCPVDVAPEDDPCNAPYGSATVVDERFEFRVDGLDPGDVEVFVAFDPVFGDQPADVARRYGPLGQRMTGPQLVDSGGGAFRAQVTETVTVR